MWFTAGAALGVGGTIWAEQRVRRAVRQAAERLSPEHVAAGAVASVREAGGRVREAVVAGREARAAREAELWASLADTERPPVTHGARRAHTGHR